MVRTYTGVLSYLNIRIDEPTDAARALLVVKTLGRDPSGSEVISEPGNLATLLGFHDSFKEEPEAALEALRCIANALLLIESARATFTADGIRGGDVCLEKLEVSSSLVQCFT